MRQTSQWKVTCQVCGRVILNTVAKKRWDGIITCPNDWEEKHPSLSYRHRHRGAGGEGSIPSGGIHTGNEDTSQSILVCDVYTSMGVVGYGTTGCARTGTYNYALSPLPSTTGILGPENPIIDPGADPYYEQLIFNGLFSDNSKIDYSPIRDTINSDSINIVLDGTDPILGASSLRNQGGTLDVQIWNTSTEYTSKQFSSAFTIEGFVNPVTAASGTFQVFIMLSNFIGNSTISLVEFNAVGNLLVQTTAAINDGIVHTSGQWVYFAYCWNGTQYTLWTSNNNSNVATLRVKSTNAGPSPASTGQRLYLFSQSGGSGNGFIGKLSNLRITGGRDRYGDGTVGVSTIPVPVESFPTYGPFH